MANFKFNDLSADIKTLVVDEVYSRFRWQEVKEHPAHASQIIRPSDLKNVCLVNKQLHDIAVKPLYRNVALDLGSHTDTRLSAFLSPKNIGLKHIRQIRLYLATVRDRCNQDQQAHLVTRMILEFLPEDILEEFSWCPWRPFSASNILLLYKKQRKMKWLEAMDLDRDVLPLLKKNTKMQAEIFSHVRKLALYPENRETLRLCGFFVEKTKAILEELIIHANFHDVLHRRDRSPSAESIEIRELNDSATRPGLLTREIFNHMTPFEKGGPFKNLKSLRLHRIGLRYCADTWCKLVDFSNLEYLRLYQCPGADSLFGQMCKSTHLPRQLKLLEFQHKDNAENEALMALDGFLCLVSGIRDLVIDLEQVKAMPAAAGIARHGKTLELLNVHCSQEYSSSSLSSSGDDVEELLWESEDFEKICKACTHLEQLSCAWPQTSLIRSPGEEWRAYERASGTLRELITLHVSTWPSNKPSTQPLPRAIYEHLLQALAQRGFDNAASFSNPTREASTSPDEDEAAAAGDAEGGDAEGREEPNPTDENSLRIPKLRLIAFGISDKIYEREDSRNQVIYLRSTCQDAEGKTKLHATPIGWCVRQYIEPRSEVLDFALHREARPPCREMRDGGIGWGEDDE